MGIKHKTPADGTFSGTGTTEWNRNHEFVEAGGATLDIGAISDGQYLTRSGSSLVSGVPASGPTGPTGAAGAAGAAGSTGAAGAAGATGPSGPSGPAGAAGATGASGPTGPTGSGGPSLSTLTTIDSQHVRKIGNLVAVATGPTGYTIDLNTANSFDLLLQTNASLTFANPYATGISHTFVARTVQGTGGPYTVAWPSSVSWLGGTTPTLTPGSGGQCDFFTFTTYTAGVVWFGFPGTVTGSTGPTGSAGAAGATGPSGPSGPSGAAGATGVAGAAGATGPSGPSGPSGAAGATGTAGAAGATGAAGAAGATGPSGATGGPSSTYARANITTATLTTVAMTDHPSLKIPILTTGQTYVFAFDVLFQGGTTTTGIRLGLTFPAATIVAATAWIPVAANGLDGSFQGWIAASGDSVVGTGVPALNTTYLATIEGTIRATSTGTLQLQYGAEVSTTPGVVVMQESVGVLVPIA